MPVDIVRLFDSDLYAIASGDEFRAAFTLWGRAFLQRPAASLPDDDRILAYLSGAGAKWRRIKNVAMKGWVKCSDGRLYHPVVAEKAVEAWRARLARIARTEAARAAKRGGNQAFVAGIENPTNDVNGRSVTTSVTDIVTGSKGEGEGKKVRKEDSASLRSAAAISQQSCPISPDESPPAQRDPGPEPPSAPKGDPPPEPLPIRDALWRDGLPIVRGLVGCSDTQARVLLGRMLKGSHDDCARVYGALREAESLRPVDPRAWLMQAAEPPEARGARASLGPKSQRQRADEYVLRQLGLLRVFPGGGADAAADEPVAPCDSGPVIDGRAEAAA